MENVGITILNWYLIGVMVNLVIIYFIILFDKYKHKIELKMDKNEDVIVISLILITSWSVWLFVILFFIIKNNYKNKIITN